MSPSPLRVAALAAALAVVGLLGLVAVFDGPETYRDIARASGITGAEFHARPDLVWRTDLNGLVELHRRTLGYALGDVPALPAFASTDRPLFDDNERAHMADVRAVFQATKVAFLVGLVLVIGVLRWTDRAQRSRLIRDAAITAAIGVSVLGIAAAVAFDQLFLVFHTLFFPQGNFLFGPDSNLLVLYPEGYWYGVTLQIGLAFVTVVAIIAIAASATLRRARR
jgi:integral membrane protein (TIGR01906 family)